MRREIALSIVLILIAVTGCTATLTQPPAPDPTPAEAVPTLASSAGQVLFGRGLDVDTFEVIGPLTSSSVGEEVYAIGHFDRVLRTGPVRVLVTLNGDEIAKYDEGGTGVEIDVRATWLIVPGSLITEAGELSVVISDFGNQPVARGSLPIAP